MNHPDITHADRFIDQTMKQLRPIESVIWMHLFCMADSKLIVSPWVDKLCYSHRCSKKRIQKVLSRLEALELLVPLGGGRFKMRTEICNVQPAKNTGT